MGTAIFGANSARSKMGNVVKEYLIHSNIALAAAVDVTEGLSYDGGRKC